MSVKRGPAWPAAIVDSLRSKWRSHGRTVRQASVVDSLERQLAITSALYGKPRLSTVLRNNLRMTSAQNLECDATQHFEYDGAPGEQEERQVEGGDGRARECYPIVGVC